MELGEKLKRLLKLGFFVGAGAAATVVAACGGSGTRIDTGARDSTSIDAGKADLGKGADSGSPDAGADLAALDRGLADKGLADKGLPDKSLPDKAKAKDKGWDIPLE